MTHRSIGHRAGIVAGALVLAFVATLAGCGGGDATPASTPTPTPPAAGPTGPSAAINAASSATALTALVFDASASTSGDGSALAYSWDFGDGQRGGGKTIAHVFASAGMETVTLTVVDGSGLASTTTAHVSVSAASAAAGTATVHAIVQDAAAAALAGATVARVGSTTSATTDAAGHADLVVDTGTALVVKVSKGGYADQFVTVSLPAGAGNDATVNATLRTRDAALTLADAHAGGTLVGRAGATITLPPDALVNGAGALVSGAVDIALTPIDVTQPSAGGFPGGFDGVKADGTTTPIVSLGTVEFALAVGGQKVQVAAGKTATIEIPIYATTLLDGSTLAVGATVPLWSLDEQSAIWIQEGSGTVVASATSPSGLALRAVVAHFSWWNADMGFNAYGPKPRCVYDTDSGIPGGEDTFATATVCNFIAEFDRASNGLAASTSKRPLGVAPSASAPFNIVAYSRRGTVPIAGGQIVPVPADWGIAIVTTALNGTWAGKTIVRGPVAQVDDVVVKMRPVAASSSGVETIELPFDGTRTIQPAQTARFAFSGSADKYAQVQFDSAAGSSVTGHLRLMQGTTVLATQDAVGVAGAAITFPLPAAGNYGIEVESTSAIAGAYRLRVALIGAVQAETLAYPFDVTRDVPVFTTYRASLDVAAPGAIALAFHRMASTSTAADLRILAPDGSLLSSRQLAAGSNVPTVLALPAAGRYTIEVVNEEGAATSFRMTGDPTAWLPLGPGLAVDSGFSMIDLIADRNGKAVAGFVRYGVASGVGTTTIQLRRWSGSAWETVGSDYQIPAPCDASARPMQFAFDSTNAPLIAYAMLTPGSGSAVAVKRFASGAWQDVGPAGGVLPAPSAFSSACSNPPRLAIDASDRPIVAYRVDNTVRVQRFSAGAWSDLATTAVFNVISGGFDLALAPSGVPYFILASNGVATVSRFDAATTSWLGVGAGGGVLPQTNTSGLIGPRIRFDAGGQPVVGALASVGSIVTFTGAIVYRFDGTAWSMSPGFGLPNSFINNTPEPAVALDASGGVLMAWDNQSSDIGGSIVVQRNSGPSSWAAVGSGLGQVTQYWPHGVTGDANALDARLLVLGGETYLTMMVHVNPDALTPIIQLQLLKKVGS